MYMYMYTIRKIYIDPDCGVLVFTFVEHAVTIHVHI